MSYNRNMFPCLICGKEIAINAQSCPHCGNSDPLLVKKLKSITKQAHSDLMWNNILGAACGFMVLISLGLWGWKIALAFIVACFFFICLAGMADDNAGRLHNTFIANEVEPKGISASDYIELLAMRNERKVFF